jgi:hypothetical protein
MTSLVAIALLALSSLQEPDWKTWERRPREFAGASFDGGKLTLGANAWSSLVSPAVYEDFEATLTFSILEAAKNTSYLTLKDWGVWTDFGASDEGYELGVLLRDGPEGGYRVQVSAKLQEIALLSYPKGSFLRVAPGKIPVNTPHEIRVSVQGNHVIVKLDGEEKIDYVEECVPRGKGAFGLGCSSGGKVAVERLRLAALPKRAPEKAPPHTARLAAREWRERTWIFDGQEPILQLFQSTELPINSNVKLKPGFRAMLIMEIAWNPNSPSDYPEEVQTLSRPRCTPKDGKLEVAWEGKDAKGRFGSQIMMTVGYDPGRGMYTYDFDRTLEMAPGKEFNFQRGLYFEHHDATDPFAWKYMIFKREDGQIYYRPLCHYFDPGSFPDAAMNKGFRAWVGRVDGPDLVSPAVEYEAPTASWETGPASFAVCAWGYDTGIGFPGRILKGGDKIRVKYRYTGYPAEEMKAKLAQAKIYPLPRLDPRRHMIFAKGWPKLDFSKFAALSEWWPYGSIPWQNAHNGLPDYSLEQKSGYGSGFAIKFGALAHAEACLESHGPVRKGRYVVSAHAKGDHLYGPGAYLQVWRMKEHTGDGYAGTGTVLGKEVHHFGNGTFDWKRVGFVAEISEDAPALAISLGNAGTGEVLFGDLEILPLKDGEAPPAGIAAKGNPRGAEFPPAPVGALADYRMEEGRGSYVLDAAGSLGPLELANVAWTTDEGRPALKFADNPSGRQDYVPQGIFAQNHFKNLETAPRQPDPRRQALAIAGVGGGQTLLRSWSVSVDVKPAARMDPEADILGFGSRAFKLVLKSSPGGYLLGARLNYNEQHWTEATLRPDAWSRITVTGDSKPGEKARLSFYVNGRLVKESQSPQVSELNVHPPLILGSEIFYLDHGFYHGLIGRVTIYGRALTPGELGR